MAQITQAQVGSGSYQLKDAEVNGGSTLKLAINPSAAEISAFDVGSMWIETPPPAYLEFSSDSNFTLSVSSPNWNGTLEYSLDNGSTWSTWDGSQLSGTASQPICLRGIGNTRITGSSTGYKWSFTGKYITGNIETLLDYQAVDNEQHPTMSANCYDSMFYGCTSLATAPKLLATTLTTGCYHNMFHSCTSLTTAPELPATTLTSTCYSGMFNGCTSLKLSTTQTGEYQYPYRIPTSGTGTTASASLSLMFNNTGGTFTGTPTINTTYYTDHEPV